jgi:Reverse transcriptase (RNA-dependent DNA polymerase)
MGSEVEELEGHDTWTIVNRTDIKPVINDKGEKIIPTVIPTTWAFKIKRWPDGTMRKIKARFCVRGDLQTEGVNVFETYAPVSSWNSIRMLSVMALQNGWVTKQIDFSNAFVQAPLDKDVYVVLPAMFMDTSGIDAKNLCLKLNKSLYGMREAPKLWNDWLSKALIKAEFKPSAEDPGVYYGRGMAIVVYVDDVLFYGPDESEMEKVIEELQYDDFELK